ncbi:MAG: type IV secretion system protein [Aquisalinus sp.]|nr:type IV secretion system protein [Aquisalinus sp.]
MKKLLSRAALVLALSFFPVSPAIPQGIPVIDTSQIAQVIAQLQQQIRDYEEQVKQLTNMQQRLEAMTGAKGISSILNSSAERTAREAATDLQSIVSAAIGGGNISGNVGNMNTVISDLKSRFDLGDLGDFDSSDIPADKAIASLAGSGLAAVATAEDSYTRANAAVGRVNALVDQIDSTADLKASVDFNTRVNAEVAVLLLELLRVQSAQANATGMQALQIARDGQASRNFMKTGDN